MELVAVGLASDRRLALNLLRPRGELAYLSVRTRPCVDILA
jgi:hypothetical protein